MERPRVRRADALAIALLLAAGTAVFADVLFGRRVLFEQDLTLLYEPYARILRAVVSSGEFPFWNRFTAAGQPLAANPHFGLFYPLKWLIFLSPFRLGFQLHLVLHVHIALMTMYLLLRSMGLRVPSALFGAITYGIGGALVSSLQAPPFLFAAAWLPLVLLFVRRLVLRPTLRGFAAASLALGLQHLTGDAAAVLQTLLLCSAYAVFRGLRPFKTRLVAANLLLVVAVGACGSITASIRLLPAAEAWRDVRKTASPAPADGTIRALRPVELFFPLAVARRVHLPPDDSRSAPLKEIYLGLMAAVLAAAGVVERKRGALLVAGLGAVSYLLASGAAGVTGLVLHQPERMLFFGIVALNIFAARVFDQCIGGDRQLVRVSAALAGLAGFIALTMFAFSHLDAYRQLYSVIWRVVDPRMVEAVVTASRADWLTAVARSTAVAALFSLVLFRGLRRSWYAMVAAVILLELGPAARSTVARMPEDFFDQPSSAAAVKEALSGSRFFHEAHLRETLFPATGAWGGSATYWMIRNGLYPRTAASWGIESVLEPDFDRRLLPATREFHTALLSFVSGREASFPQQLLDMSNVGLRAVHLPASAPERAVGAAGPLIFTAGDVHPRYYFADHLVRVSGVAGFMEQIARGGHSSRVALVEGDPFDPAAGEVLGVRETPNRAWIEVRTPARAFLIMSVTSHRHWRARIGGSEASLVTTNLGYQGLVIPPGRHRVELRYFNPYVPLGAGISALSLLALLLLALRKNVSQLTPRSSAWK